MALWDEVKLRFSSRVLKELTNADVPNASAINDTLGTQAANDTIKWFQRVATSVTFDVTDQAMVEICVRATVHKLKQWAGKLTDKMGTEAEALEADMLNYAKSVAARGRVVPTTNSVLDPTPEDKWGTPVRPEFDDQRFTGLFPGQPPAP